MSSELLFIDYSVEGASEHCVTLNIVYDITAHRGTNWYGCMYTLCNSHIGHTNTMLLHTTLEENSQTAQAIFAFSS